MKSVGAEVTRFKVGDVAAVGCLVDSDGTCPSAAMASSSSAPTRSQPYGGRDRHLDQQTYGGYSESIVVDERFVLRVPPNLDLAAAAPLVCAGITTWSPLRHHRVGPGSRVGIVGLGGLGHMGLKFARALGAHVVVHHLAVEDRRRSCGSAPTRSWSRPTTPRWPHAAAARLRARHRLGAARRQRLTTPLLRDGNLTLVGAAGSRWWWRRWRWIFGRRNVSGGLADRRPRRDAGDARFLRPARHRRADVEMVRIQDVNTAWERLAAEADVKFRFVIDVASLRG